MVSRVGMAGGALDGRALVDILLVAFGALDIDMRTIQRETTQAVVKSGVFPIARVMTGFASCAILTLVGIIGLVAGETIFGGSCVPLGMATLARHIHMLAFKREIAQAVIEFGRFPGFGRVTNAALRAKFAVVSIVFLMTGFAGPLGGL